MPSCRPIYCLLFLSYLTILGDGGACLYGPRPVLDLHQCEVVHDLLGLECELQVLLVRKHEQGHVLEGILSQQALQLLYALLQAHLVRRVHHIHQTVRVFIVVLPVGADRLLTANVPHVQLEAILGLNGEKIVTVRYHMGAVLGVTLTRALMLKPWVGWMVEISSSERALRMVVLPALSRPSTRIRASFSLFLRLLKSFKRPIILS